MIMELFEASIGPAHATVGFIGLAAFWVPVFSRKGGRRHVTFGRIFVYSAYVSLGLAGLSVVYRLSKLILAGSSPAQDPGSFSFLIFLGYLALVTFINVHHAVGVLRTKKDPDSLRTPGNLALGQVAILASIGLIAYTFYFQPPLGIVFLALSPFGLGIGYRINIYLSKNRRRPRSWLFHHLGGMLGAGIAFHTAFAVFGSSRLFDYELAGILEVLPWILPTAIGLPAISIWSRHYRKLYARRATGRSSPLLDGQAG